MNKSKALRIMAGDAWFTDTVSLGDDPKVMIEQTRGKWIVEVPELGEMARRDVEAVKAQLSRQADRARLAYGRSTTEVARQFILVGTNNPDCRRRIPQRHYRQSPVSPGASHRL